jgi:hypothetical protein
MHDRKRPDHFYHFLLQAHNGNFLDFFPRFARQKLNLPDSKIVDGFE